MKLADAKKGIFFSKIFGTKKPKMSGLLLVCSLILIIGCNTPPSEKTISKRETILRLPIVTNFEKNMKKAQYEESMDTFLRLNNLSFLQKDTAFTIPAATISDFLPAENKDYIFINSEPISKCYHGLIYANHKMALNLVCYECQIEDYGAKRFLLQLLDSKNGVKQQILIGEHLVGEWTRRRDFSIENDFKIKIQTSNNSKAQLFIDTSKLSIVRLK